jgi:hypothetical protein
LSTKPADPQQDSAGGDVHNPQTTPVLPLPRSMNGGTRREAISGSRYRFRPPLRTPLRISKLVGGSDTKSPATQASRHARAPGYRRGSDMARNVQTEPKDGPQRQKEEAGAVVDRGKSRVCSACTTRCLSLPLKQEGHTSDQQDRTDKKERQTRARLLPGYVRLKSLCPENKSKLRDGKRWR